MEPALRKMKESWKNLKKSSLERLDLAVWEVADGLDPEELLETCVQRSNLYGVKESIRVGARGRNIPWLIKNILTSEDQYDGEKEETQYQILKELLKLYKENLKSGTSPTSTPNSTTCSRSDCSDSIEKVNPLVTAITYRKVRAFKLLAQELYPLGIKKFDILSRIKLLDPENSLDRELLDVICSSPFYDKQWTQDLFVNAVQKISPKSLKYFAKLGADPTDDGNYNCLKLLTSLKRHADLGVLVGETQIRTIKETKKRILDCTDSIIKLLDTESLEHILLTTKLSATGVEEVSQDTKNHISQEIRSRKTKRYLASIQTLELR